LEAEFDPLATQRKPRTMLTLKFEEVAIAAGMAAIALITAANVVVRYLTNISFAFTEEYSVVLMVIVTVLGTSLAMAGGRHIKIEYFSGLLNARGQRMAEIVAMGLVIVCFGIIAV
jgi:TRAP-type C4-dicarboxylate transport system permease small subunit